MADTQKRWKEKRAKFVSTLVYVDEPQVVVLDHGNDAKIIGVAIEKEGYEYPFLGAEISFTQWERYNRQFVDLRYLFLLPRWKRWYIFDLGQQDESDHIPLEKADKEDLKDEKYLPSHGFWARGHTEEDPVFGVSAGVVSQRFMAKKAELDGVERVKRYLKAELKRADVTYEDLAARLQKIGLDETEASVANKLSRGTFPATFFVAVAEAIGIENIRIKDI